MLPVFNAFKDAIEAISHIKTQYLWSLYLIPQWKNNWSLAKAWNEGTKQAFEEGNDFVLIINDDAFVEPNTIDKLVSVLQATDHLLVSATERPNNQSVHFSCFMVGWGIFEEVGFFDENFKPIYFEDNDFIYRMRLLGVKFTAVKDAFFEHKGSQSLKNKRLVGQGPQHDKEFEANQAYYIKKWGGMPGKEIYTTPLNNGGSVKEWTLDS